MSDLRPPRSRPSDAPGAPLAGAARRGASAVVALLVLLLAPGPERAAAQETIAGLAAECGGGSAEVTAWCRELALAGQAARDGFALLAGGGSELVGSAGTLGWRLGSVPRLAVAVEVGGAHVPAPRFSTVSGSEALADDSFRGQSLQVGAGVGVFDGFSPVPTVGGLLSVDLLATGSVVFLPEGHGFEGSSPAYGIGGRLGLLRESFTLPGLSVSAVHRWGGEVTLLPTAPTTGPARPRVSFETSTTSLRATVGKDLLAVGLLAGMGWDRHGGRLRVEGGLPVTTGGSPAVGVSEELVDTRLLAFGSATMSFLILHLTAEVGWAEGLDPVPGRPGGGYDPTASSWFGSLGARLTY